MRRKKGLVGLVSMYDMCRVFMKSDRPKRIAKKTTRIVIIHKMISCFGFIIMANSVIKPTSWKDNLS